MEKDKNLKEEILEMLEIFELYQIPEDKQKELISKGGLDFDFTYGDPDPHNRNKSFNVFEVADILKVCNILSIPLDANHMIDYPFDTEYEELINGLATIGKSKRKK